MAKNEILNIEIAYAYPTQQYLEAIQVAAGTTIEMAIRQSGVLTAFPEIDLATQTIGVFSKQRQLSDLVSDGDRIEIYRPLTIDPKEARRLKAKKT